MDRLPVLARSTPLELSQDLQQLAAGWLLGYSAQNTRVAYRRDLSAWLSWCADHDLDPLSVVRPHADAYARALEAEGRAAATVARKLSAMASWYSYCEDEGAVVRSPLARVRRPRVGTESQSLGLDRDELHRFLDAAEAAGPRDHALALLLGVNGLRVSEALAIDAADLDTVRGHCTVTITGKGGRSDLGGSSETL